MPKGKGNSDGFSWFNFKVQIISQGDAEIGLSLTYDISIFFNNDSSVSGRPPDVVCGFDFSAQQYDAPQRQLAER